MENRHEIGLGSYERLFPSQDTLPKGGFGSLIALPLQRHSRKHGNSVFLDEVLQPHVDQWRFLESVHRIRVDTLAERLPPKNQSPPYFLQPLLWFPMFSALRHTLSYAA